MAWTCVTERICEMTYSLDGKTRRKFKAEDPTMGRCWYLPGFRVILTLPFLQP